MIWCVMLTMCAWRIWRRLTMSVICMREPSSFACACAAKMLTCARSRSARIGRRQRDERPRRESLQHEGVVRRADGLDFVHQRGARCLHRLAIGDDGDALVRLEPQAGPDGVARTREAGSSVDRGHH